MAEIGKKRMLRSDGERDRVCIEGLVDRGTIAGFSSREAGDELVREADALGGTEGVAGPVAIKLAQGLIVAVLKPLFRSEKGAKGGQG